MSYEKYKERVFNMIDENKDDLIRLMQDLIRFKTVNPPGNETPCAEFLAEKLRGVGFTVQLPAVQKERANVVAKMRGKTGNPSLLCYAHIDVVPPGDLSSWKVDPFAEDIEGEKIYGRGSQDHKFPMPPLLSASKAIREAGVKLNGDLVYTFTADEEELSEVGFRYLVENGYFNDTDSLLYFSAGRKGRIGVGANGQQVYEITVKGRISHTP